MQKIILLTLLFASIFTSSIKSVNPTQAKDFVIGFFTGMGATAKVPDANDCIAFVQDTVQELENVKSISDIIKIVQEMSTKGKSCVETAGEGTQVEKDIVNAFSSPMIIAENALKLVENSGEVMSDITDGASDIQSDNFFAAGAKFGDIVKVYIY